MSKFNIGDNVQKANENTKGVIIRVMPARRGRQLYQVNWGSLTSDELEADLLPIFDSSDPYERCASGIFDSYTEYSKKNTTFKIKKRILGGSISRDGFDYGNDWDAWK